jgi:pimeloyl-ACP methyl ester carboxylesterase
VKRSERLHVHGNGFDVIGCGMPVYFLHGFGMGRRFLQPLDGYFRDSDCRRVYLDLPGFGDLRQCAVSSTLDVVTKVLTFIRQDAVDSEVAIVGNSFGALVARGVASRLGDQVNGMCLIAPVVHAERGKRDLPTVSEPRTPDWLVREDPDLVREFRSMGGPMTVPSWDAFLDTAAPYLRVPLSAGATSIQENYDLPDRPEANMALADAAPVLAIAGRHDPIVGYRDIADLLATDYRHGECVIVAKAGHNVHLDAPWIVGSLVRAWIDRVNY